MNEFSRYSWLPSNAEEYRRWYTQYLPKGVEHGTCWCGCGTVTDRPHQTAIRDLRFKGEPVRFVRGHFSKTSMRAAWYKAWWLANTQMPYGYCWCGCGQRTYAATQTRLNTSTPTVIREPVRYINGHHRDIGSMSVDEYKDYWRRNTASPYGYCWCGCGTATSIAKSSSSAYAHVGGEPRHYVQGHAFKNQFSEADSRLRYAVEHLGYESPCWIWQGSTTGGLFPYGRIRVNGKLELTHRYLYQQKYGAIDVKEECHHKCEVTLCCNPDHITTLTRLQHRRLHHSL